MLHKIKAVKNIVIFHLVARRLRNKTTFADDIYVYVQTYLPRSNKIGRLSEGQIVFAAICKRYGTRFDSIEKNLYLGLRGEDKDTLVRWFLKAWFGVDTATEDESKTISDAFGRTQNLYRESNTDAVDFIFRGRHIRYKKNPHLRPDDSKENILMNYYDITHAFFLVEYEKDGFNPTNGQVILDCGAAFGDTLLLFRCLYPDSEIISFEAVEENLDVIRDNMQANQIENARLEKAYLYADSEKHYMDKSTWNIEDIQPGENTREIQTLSIDDYVEKNGIENIGLIKFDIEGGEQKALEGSVRTIKRFKPMLYIPIYHLESDIYKIPEFLAGLNLPMRFSLKWTEKLVWGVDCVLFVRFDDSV